MSLEHYYTWLGQADFPAAPLLQGGSGLDAYIPAALAGMPGKPDGVPDQTAIIFWDDQQAHTDGPKHYGVRIYHLMHSGVYSSTPVDWPQQFTGELAAEQPYFLVDRPADWMPGPVTHVAGSRPTEVSPADFRSGVAEELRAVQAAGDVSGALACAGDEYLVYWVLGTGAPGATALAGRCGWKHVVEAEPIDLSDVTLYEEWPGLTIEPGDCINARFRRRWER